MGVVGLAEPQVAWEQTATWEQKRLSRPKNERELLAEISLKLSILGEHVGAVRKFQEADPTPKRLESLAETLVSIKALLENSTIVTYPNYYYDIQTSITVQVGPIPLVNQIGRLGRDGFLTVDLGTVLTQINEAQSITVKAGETLKLGGLSIEKITVIPSPLNSTISYRLFIL